MTKLKLSALDQTPISAGETAETAIHHTVTLAQTLESLQFHRFWVSEHHDSESLAGSSPELMISYLAAVTDSIRLGSGGVMLPHYSEYKVAENFKLLSGLAPGRIDAGLGRAPGGMHRASIALADGKVRGVERFSDQIDEFLGYTHDMLASSHPLHGLKATPIIQHPPETWILGSSISSAYLAAEKGLPYTFAHFINGEEGDRCTYLYRSRFKPSTRLSQPKNIVAVFAVCAPTTEEANKIASSLDLMLVRSEQGIVSNGIPSIEEALAHSYTSYEQSRIISNRERMIVGSPAQVKEKLLRLSEAYETDEIMLVSNMYRFEDKCRSFELIANQLL